MVDKLVGIVVEAYHCGPREEMKAKALVSKGRRLYRKPVAREHQVKKRGIVTTLSSASTKKPRCGADAADISRTAMIPSVGSWWSS